MKCYKCRRRIKEGKEKYRNARILCKKCFYENKPEESKIKRFYYKWFNG